MEDREAEMRLVAGLVISILIVVLFRKAIKKVPWVFYLLAVALAALLIIGNSLSFPSWFREYFLFLLQSNNLAMGLFTIVMFAGAFKEQSPLRKVLIPIRAELSIIASLLCIGHIVNYGNSYLDQLLSPTALMPVARLWATLIAFLLVVVLIPLAITSFKAIHARMSPRSWKRLQRLAYPFYLLIFLHMFFYLLPPAIAGSLSALISLVLYLVLGAVYLVLRVRLYLQTRRVILEPAPVAY
jgi:DMSO/TMAO reductase YedYZ heme-binding membrane subunit